MGGRPAVAGREFGGAVTVGAGGEDALDRAVGGVTGGQRPRAGGLDPLGRVLVGQAEHPLGGAQPEQRVDCQQVGDDRAGSRAEFGGAGRHQVGVRMWKAIRSGG